VDGDVYIAYSWGDQRGQEFLGAAVVKGATTDQWQASLFPSSPTASAPTSLLQAKLFASGMILQRGDGSKLWGASARYLFKDPSR